ncbi:MAG TPA: response regulator [Paraburkholderia sp.]|jgi:CheY-like chemotaxis protein
MQLTLSPQSAGYHRPQDAHTDCSLVSRACRMRHHYSNIQCMRGGNMSRVLIVDDEPDSLWAMQLAIERLGQYVMVAKDGEVALRIAARQLPDLIVTDCNMPVMDGIELCSRLRSYPSLGLIPIVMVSASDLQATEAQRLYDAFLRKPFGLDDLSTAVSRLLTQRLQRYAAIRATRSERGVPRWQSVFPGCWP